MQDVAKSVRSLEALLLFKSKHHRENRVTVYRERCQESEVTSDDCRTWD